MAAGEIRVRLGISRQRVYQLSLRPDWPVPYDELTVGKVWRREDIEEWIATHRPWFVRQTDCAEPDSSGSGVDRRSGDYRDGWCG